MIVDLLTSNKEIFKFDFLNNKSFLMFQTSTYLYTGDNKHKYTKHECHWDYRVNWTLWTPFLKINKLPI